MAKHPSQQRRRLFPLYDGEVVALVLGCTLAVFAGVYGILILIIVVLMNWAVRGKQRG